MSQGSFESLFREAVRVHQAGKLEEAEAGYRGALAVRVEAHAVQMLGVVVAQRGRVNEGVELIRKAIGMSPGVAGYWGNLGFVLAGAGRTGEAVEAFERAVELGRGDAAARLNLAQALRQTGRLDDAIREYREAMKLCAPSAETWNALGATLKDAGRMAEAVECFRHAVSLRGDSGEFLYNLSDAFLAVGEAAQAEAVARRAIAMNVRDAAAWFNLGNALWQQGSVPEAAEAFRTCVDIRPDLPEARHNLGATLRELGRLDDAFEQLHAARSLGLDGFELRNNTGLVVKDMGEPQEAVGWFEKALELKHDPIVESNLIYTSQFLPGVGPSDMRGMLSRWNERYARPLARELGGWTNDQNAGRRLRIGYVAPNLGNHPVGRFFLPLVKGHDRGGFEIYIYGDFARDHIGEQIRAAADVWRTTKGLTDEQVARQVREDRIDILVDLMMHVGHHRLGVFARKPAPVQVTYLAYPGSTGLETIDYRLTDPFLEPPAAANDALCSEKSVRLPHSFWCYAEPPEAPPVGKLPASWTGGVTFGSLNSAMKINDAVAAAWARVLREVPGSRLVVHAREGPEQRCVALRLERNGVEMGRLSFAGKMSLEAYFSKYDEIDVGLDPFPYPGGTTTCDALWMGVPVVTLAGETALSRGGVSILSNVGLGELVAWDVDEYVGKAAELGRDLARLGTLRAGMRGRMRGSALMDVGGFVRGVEGAYRGMWERWCLGGKTA